MKTTGPVCPRHGPTGKIGRRTNMGPSIAFVRIDLMEGGGCTEWIFIDECDWRVIVRV